MFKLLVVSCLLGLAVSMPQAKNELTCEICVDVITDLDNWLTSDATEQDIVDFVKELCAALGVIIPDLEDTCNALIETQLPGIIDDLVNNNLNPTEVCTNISACP
ncbi:proactivator polypeptide-like 1 [Eurytemora carolleeae]|uniref:proactivator polypeptide-like 1 n=1 Tax=Eurytemora carolleeae TaxID=1294199 RepID=UPI000C7797A8|nr:proactivator polypeptide-like 1 [Eurytemora carolleeae]|eukprot:XP_023346711.1 proactivator polypeptide-like 1 [Eurytemora affinis]